MTELEQTTRASELDLDALEQTAIEAAQSSHCPAFVVDIPALIARCKAAEADVDRLAVAVRRALADLTADPKYSKFRDNMLSAHAIITLRCALDTVSEKKTP